MSSISDFTMYQYIDPKSESTILPISALANTSENGGSIPVPEVGPVIIPPSYQWDSSSSLERLAEHIAMYRPVDPVYTSRVQSILHNAKKQSYVARLVWGNPGQEKYSEILKLSNNHNESTSHRFLSNYDLDGAYIPKLYEHNLLLPSGISAVLMEDRSSLGRFSARDKSVPAKLQSLIKAASCLDFVHAHGSHGDVKAGNFMGSGDDVRIIDLEGYGEHNGITLTTEYAAPEVLRRYGLNLKARTKEGLTSEESKKMEFLCNSFDQEAAKANDVYGFGVVVQRILANPNLLKQHRRLQKNDDLYQQILGLSSSPHGIYVPAEMTRLRETLQACYDMDPNNRPKIHEVKRSLIETLNQF